MQWHAIAFLFHKNAVVNEKNLGKSFEKVHLDRKYIDLQFAQNTAIGKLIDDDDRIEPRKFAVAVNFSLHTRDSAMEMTLND